MSTWFKVSYQRKYMLQKVFFETLGAWRLLCNCWKVFFLLTDLIKRLEEENKVNVYLCQEKLPKVKSNVRLDKDKQNNCHFYSVVRRMITNHHLMERELSHNYPEKTQNSSKLSFIFYSKIYWFTFISSYKFQPSTCCLWIELKNKLTITTSKALLAYWVV